MTKRAALYTRERGAGSEEWQRMLEAADSYDIVVVAYRNVLGEHAGMILDRFADLAERGKQLAVVNDASSIPAWLIRQRRRRPGHRLWKLAWDQVLVEE